jgi:DNA-binding MarR family transcriptional regulator
MTASVRNRQDAVKPSGDVAAAMTTLLVEVIRTAELFTRTGEELARPEGQTLARWLVLGSVAAEPRTVAEVARGLRLARQSVQRVADLLERDGLVAYEPNPRHRRAKLARLTPTGAEVLGRIQRSQATWARQRGAAIGLADLERATSLLLRVRELVGETRPGGTPGTPTGGQPV